MIEYFDKEYVDSRHEYVRELRSLSEVGPPEPEEDWDAIYVFSGPELTLDSKERPDKQENNPYNQTLTRLETGFDIAKKVTALKMQKKGIDISSDAVTVDNIREHGPSIYFDGYEKHNEELENFIDRGELANAYGFPDDKFIITGSGTKHTGEQIEKLPAGVIDSSRKIVFVSDLYHIPRIRRYIGSKYDKYGVAGIPWDKLVLSFPSIGITRVTVGQAIREARKMLLLILGGHLNPNPKEA